MPKHNIQITFSVDVENTKEAYRLAGNIVSVVSVQTGDKLLYNALYDFEIDAVYEWDEDDE